MTRNEALAKALEEYRVRREERQALQARREDEVRTNYPEIARLMDERVHLLFSGLSQSVQGGDAAQAAQTLRTRGVQLNEEIRKALDACGLGRDYLSAKPDCPLCGDTGYLPDSVPQRTCECLIRRTSQLMRQDEADAPASFETFDEGRIPQTEVAPGVTQRALACRIRDICRDWADMYPNTLTRGILLSGQAGLGKSFLMRCMARALEDRGVQVCAIPSFKLLELIRLKHFGDSGEGFEALLNAPVLMIDDLGSEPTINNVSGEYLCILLEERITKRMHTVISTNLTPTQFKAQYSERVMSRLCDTRYWDQLHLEGKDLRRA